MDAPLRRPWGALFREMQIVLQAQRVNVTITGIDQGFNRQMVKFRMVAKLTHAR